MTTKNIQDVVAERVKTFGNHLACQLTPSNEAMRAVRWAREELEDTLTQLVKEVEAGERDAFEEGRMFAYNEALDACNVNETSEQVADDIRQKIRRPDIYETKRTPPPSDVTEK